MIDGSTPTTPAETSRPIHCSPSSRARLTVVITTAAAPSVMPLALPGVTTPSFDETCREFAELLHVQPRARAFVFFYAYRRAFRTGNLDGNDLLVKVPVALRGKRALLADSANSSHSSRATPYFFARFSAVIAIGVLP